MKPSTKLKTLLITGAALAMISGTAAAHGNGGLSFSFGVPAPIYATPAPVYVAPAPVYYPPAPVYAPAPAYYYPPGTIYVPPQVVYGPEPFHGPLYRERWRGYAQGWGR